jgi:hypothetical protein
MPSLLLSDLGDLIDVAPTARIIRGSVPSHRVEKTTFPACLEQGTGGKSPMNVCRLAAESERQVPAS